MGYQPYICMMTNSTCYKDTRQMQVKGVLWHSTGANNPWLCRYVQPTDGSPNYDEAIKKLGKNKYGNDWNHTYVDAGLNAWIGLFDDGTVGTVQTMPWDFRPWGCGAGDRGSCNNGWIQFEICEDDLKDKDYAEKVFEEACQLTAYLCRMFKLNPNGKADCSGISVPVITCHNEAGKMDLGSDHADINHWFPKLIGKGMPDVRKRVAEILNGEQPQPTPTPSPSTDKWIGGFPNLPGRGYFMKGDGYNTYTNMKSDIKLIQSFMNWAIDAGLDVDGEYGNLTTKSVTAFQKLTNIRQDGRYGEQTLGAAKNFTKDATVYIVKAGDTLSKIADRYGVTVDYLVKKNNIQDPNVIYIGQKIYI